MAQAEKKLNSGGGFFGMFSNPTLKAEEAASLYRDAGVKFKVAKMWQEAGEAYIKSAEAFVKAELPHEAATSYQEAVTPFKKVSQDDAVMCMEKAAATYLDMGRFAMAAKQFKSIGEVAEKDLADLTRAKEFYKRAADAFESEDSQTSADKLKLKIASISAQEEEYEEAWTLFEEVVERMVDNNLLKFGSKEYYLKAGVCRLLSGDVVATKRAFEGYTVQYSAFGDTREWRLLQGLIEACEENDVEKFQQALAEYDSVQKLDSWMTTICLRLKKTLSAEEDIL
ncbi:uncharacterized protein MONBRDRAFT_19147 [Monosiga brevicollis MX1]|uniref:Alpha-soluble NSF attachment protein n=1 Tax=Monosiga brevicollis TaxID=81824 RepID=A9UPQ6_MONBE|nr:uncharacterized protein MONBRDRAFT_19147 [Monosiga brevicollis MX1]EDQ92465.1 predicted protein [Monosiga brevicollis MX1]|eukprot:XP_001742227.1 hypothetical protein [Monosiga brevicollis MX1]